MKFTGSISILPSSTHFSIASLLYSLYMFSYTGAVNGANFWLISPGRNPMSGPAPTGGLVIITFSTSFLNKRSSATFAASSDLPDPALPFSTVTV